MSSLGDDCLSRTGNVVRSYTYIWTKYSFPTAGHIFSWCVYASINSALSAKLKVFRDDGTNFVFVGESSLIALVQGNNSGLAADINIQSGDYIGVYLEGNNDSDVGRSDSGSTTIYTKSGDISSNSLKSSWGSGTIGNLSLKVEYGISDTYVNSSTGNDSNAGDSCVAGHPVQTFGKAYDLLNSAGTIYICNDGADFSSENITFTKPYSTTQGAAGVTNYKSPRFN